MFFTIYERQISQTKITTEEAVFNLLSLLSLELAGIITREKEPEISNYKYIKKNVEKIQNVTGIVQTKIHDTKKESVDNSFGFYFGFQLRIQFNEWVRGIIEQILRM